MRIVWLVKRPAPTALPTVELQFHSVPSPQAKRSRCREWRPPHPLCLSNRRVPSGGVSGATVGTIWRHVPSAFAW